MKTAIFLVGVATIAYWLARLLCFAVVAAYLLFKRDFYLFRDAWEVFVLGKD